MLLLVAPTAADGVNLLAAAACMCPDADGTVVAVEVVVPPDMHCSPVVGESTAVVVVVVAVISGVVGVGVTTLTDLSADVPSTLLVCLAKTCPSPFVLSLSTLVLLLFHQVTFCAARACMHLRRCWPHTV